MPVLNDRLHNRTIIGVKTSEHDFNRVDGNASIGDDLPGRDDSMLKTSGKSTGLRSLRYGPACGLSNSRGFTVCPVN